MTVRPSELVLFILSLATCIYSAFDANVIGFLGWMSTTYLLMYIMLDKHLGCV